MLARTIALIIEHLSVVLKALKEAGFVTSDSKTDTEGTVSQVKLYLGFVIDSTTMTIKVSEEKLDDLKDALRTVTEVRGKIRAKTLAKAIGKLVAAEPAMGPVVQLLSRMAQFELARVTEEKGWTAWMEISEEAKNSLKEMSNSLAKYNGYPIKNVATAKKLDVFIDASNESKDKEAPTQLLRIQDTTKHRVLAGDASAVATCALEVGEQADFFTQYILEQEEQKYSSGQRELLTVLRALQQEKKFFETLRGQTVIWITDSTNLVSFLTKGTMKMAIQRQILAAYELLSQYNIRVIPVHLKRTDYRIQWADEGSREFDPDDWTIDNASYRRLTAKWVPTVDLFAHSSNAKTSKFYSYGNAPKTTGVDAFAQCWAEEIAWICPPTHLITDAIRKVTVTKMMAILVIPAWRTASFWSAAFPDGKHAFKGCVHIEEFRPHVIRGKFCANKLMQGRTSFPFLALYIRSAGVGTPQEAGKTKYESKQRI